MNFSGFGKKFFGEINMRQSGIWLAQIGEIHESLSRCIGIEYSRGVVLVSLGNRAAIDGVLRLLPKHQKRDCSGCSARLFRLGRIPPKAGSLPFSGAHKELPYEN